MINAIVSNDLAQIEAINKKIHDGLLSCKQPYIAAKYSEVFYNNSTSEYALMINRSKKRNSCIAQALNSREKRLMKKINFEEWTLL